MKQKTFSANIVEFVLEKAKVDQEQRPFIHFLCDNQIERMVHVKYGDPFFNPLETSVLHYVACGHTSREIAEFVGRSPRTVEAIIGTLKRKLKARTMPQLIMKATSMSLINMDTVATMEKEYEHDGEA